MTLPVWRISAELQSLDSPPQSYLEFGKDGSGLVTVRPVSKASNRASVGADCSSFGSSSSGSSCSENDTAIVTTTDHTCVIPYFSSFHQHVVQVRHVVLLLAFLVPRTCRHEQFTTPCQSCTVQASAMGLLAFEPTLKDASGDHFMAMETLIAVLASIEAKMELARGLFSGELLSSQQHQQLHQQQHTEDCRRSNGGGGGSKEADKHTSEEGTMTPPPSSNKCMVRPPLAKKKGPPPMTNDQLPSAAAAAAAADQQRTGRSKRQQQQQRPVVAFAKTGGGGGVITGSTVSKGVHSPHRLGNKENSRKRTPPSP
ncbi:MAG: hypothetical protein M1825_003443 [Sarcosagium campestre]|nr:MAG: hypothetical protein M1825_003443 [Sarcosagium campestre]